MCINSICRGTDKTIACDGILVGSVCKAVCPSLTLAPNAKYASCPSLIEGTTCTFACEANYVAVGSQSGLTCGPDGAWEGTDDFRCVLFTPELQIAGGDLKVMVAPGQDIVFNLGATVDSVSNFRRKFDDLNTRVGAVDSTLTATISNAAQQALSNAMADSTTKSVRFSEAEGTSGKREPACVREIERQRENERE